MARGVTVGAYDISQVSVQPRPTFQARPVYPAALRNEGIGGEGVVSFVVGVDGRVTDAVVVRASDPRFGQAALDCIAQWRFQPAQLNGVPVPCHMAVPIVFAVTQR